MSKECRKVWRVFAEVREGPASGESMFAYFRTAVKAKREAAQMRRIGEYSVRVSRETACGRVRYGW